MNLAEFWEHPTFSDRVLILEAPKEAPNEPLFKKRKINPQQQQQQQPQQQQPTSLDTDDQDDAPLPSRCEFRRIRVNSLVLAQASGILKTMMTTPIGEEVVDKKELHIVMDTQREAMIFEAMLKMMYMPKEPVQLHGMELFIGLFLADKFEMPVVSSVLQAALMAQVASEDKTRTEICAAYLDAADTREMPESCKCIRPILQAQLVTKWNESKSEAKKLEMFQHSRITELELLLESDELNVESENALFHWLLRWLERNVALVSSSSSSTTATPVDGQHGDAKGDVKSDVSSLKRRRDDVGTAASPSSPMPSRPFPIQRLMACIRFPMMSYRFLQDMVPRNWDAMGCDGRVLSHWLDIARQYIAGTVQTRVYYANGEYLLTFPTKHPTNDLPVVRSPWLLPVPVVPDALVKSIPVSFFKPRKHYAADVNRTFDVTLLVTKLAPDEFQYFDGLFHGCTLSFRVSRLPKAKQETEDDSKSRTRTTTTVEEDIVGVGIALPHAQWIQQSGHIVLQWAVDYYKTTTSTWERLIAPWWIEPSSYAMSWLEKLPRDATGAHIPWNQFCNPASGFVNGEGKIKLRFNVRMIDQWGCVTPAE